MIEAIFKNWEILVAVSAGVWGILTYLITNRRDQAWKRSEFVCDQLEKLDDVPELAEGTKLLYGRHPDYCIDDFIRVASAESCTLEENEFFMMFERYLNFLWRICYAHNVLKTLKMDDVTAFGAYLRAISRHPGLSKYCLTEGYDDITIAIGKLDESWKKMQTGKNDGQVGGGQPAPRPESK